MWRDADEMLAAVEKAAATFKANDFSVLLVNGEKDRPDAFSTLAERMADLGIEHQVSILPDTPHNLGLHYARSGSEMMDFLGAGLRACAGNKPIQGTK